MYDSICQISDTDPLYFSHQAHGLIWTDGTECILENQAGKDNTNQHLFN